jgi:hypothetical protein
LPNPLTTEVIQIEHRHSCAANRSVSFYFITFESEVFAQRWRTGETKAPALLSSDQRLLSCRLYADCIRGMPTQGFPNLTRRPWILG